MSGSGDDSLLLSLPLFPLPSVLLPTNEGSVLVYEPRYLALFRDLADERAGGAGGRGGLFGHLLAATAAPPALMADAVGGLPRIGVAASVRSVQEVESGRLLVRAALSCTFYNRGGQDGSSGDAK